MSNKMFNLISKYTNDIEIASIDECYLDYTKIKKNVWRRIRICKKTTKRNI